MSQPRLVPLPSAERPWTVAILLFDGVEVLDFAGPFEVFSRTRLLPGLESRRDDASAPFQVFTVAASVAPIQATGGLIVQPRYPFDAAPAIDVLVIPGGFGTRALLTDEALLSWLRDTAECAQRVFSVCTGALLLARGGLLEGRRATTHWAALDLLAGLTAGVKVERDVPFVDDGVLTSAGVAAGIEAAFHLVEELCGRAVADETARYIEYHRTRSVAQ